MTKTKRPRLVDTAQPVGMFAVVRHRQNVKHAKFSALHDTFNSALIEAQRLTGERIATEGADPPFCFYVVQIVGRVGIIDGVLHSSH